MISLQEHSTFLDKLLTNTDIANQLLGTNSGFDIDLDHIPLIFGLKICPYPYKLDQHITSVIHDYRNADWAQYSTKLTNRISTIPALPLHPKSNTKLSLMKYLRLKP